MFELTNELTVITGASGALAEPIIHTLLEYGAPLALLDRNMDALLVRKASLNTKLKVECYTCDIGNFTDVEETFKKITADFGTFPLHLVNTAGYCENFPAEDYPSINAEQLIKVNLLGSLYVAQAFAKPIINNKIENASIVMIASMSGSIVNDPQPQIAYNMSKAGVIHMVKSLAVEWAKYNIRINSLSPGYIATPLTKNVINGNTEMFNRWMSLTPMKRMANPNEFAGTVLYLLSNSASSYTTGENIIVDGGYQCL